MMKERLLARRPSPAMLVAVTALVASFTGGALAAGLITTGDIQNGAVTKKKLHKNSVNTKKVKNKTLKAEDFADGQLEAGVQGIQGLEGPKGDKGEPGNDGADGADGAPGISGLERVIAESANNATDATKTVTATCPGDKKVVGTGGEIDGGAAAGGNLALRWITPTTGTPPTQVTVRGEEVNAEGDAWQLFAIALCANVAG